MRLIRPPAVTVHVAMPHLVKPPSVTAHVTGRVGRLRMQPVRDTPEPQSLTDVEKQSGGRVNQHGAPMQGWLASLLRAKLGKGGGIRG